MELQDHLTTTAILPVQDKGGRDRTAAETSACTSSSDICRTEAAANKMVPINCEYIQTHTNTLNHQCFLIMYHGSEVLGCKNLSPVYQPEPPVKTGDWAIILKVRSYRVFLEYLNITSHHFLGKSSAETKLIPPYRG